MRTNYVLIDYESVQPTSVALLDQECFKVIIFVGEKQAKVSFELASSLQRLGAKATYIRMAGSGPNALDFHIAFYVGHLAAAEPDAYFHIISKDTGFDPLISHLKEKKIFAARSKDVTEIPILMFLAGWYVHARYQRRVITAEIERMAAERNTLQSKNLGQQRIESSKRRQ